MNAIATDNYENKISKVKILLDSGSHQTFISEEMAKELNLKPVINHLYKTTTRLR